MFSGCPHERPSPLQAKQSQQAYFGSIFPSSLPFWDLKVALDS